MSYLIFEFLICIIGLKKIENRGVLLKNERRFSNLLHFVPHPAALPFRFATFGTYNKRYTRKASARHFSKFFFRYATEKLRISLTLNDFFQSILIFVVGSLLWIFYFLQSERVKNTFKK